MKAPVACEGARSAALAGYPFLLCPAHGAVSPALKANRAAAGSSPNATELQRHEEREPGSREGEPVPGPDYEEDEEEYEEAPPVHQYIVDDLIRGESAALGLASRNLRVPTYAFSFL